MIRRRVLHWSTTKLVLPPLCVGLISGFTLVLVRDLLHSSVFSQNPEYNMADVENTIDETLRLKTSYERKTTVRKYRKRARNSTRCVRRKRSKTRYYKSLNASRHQRKTTDLCESVAVFNVTEMDWVPTNSNALKHLSKEVDEWHQQEQVAYWKSRAVSLEYENRMLVQHIRNLYTSQIELYNQSRALEKDGDGSENCEVEGTVKEREFTDEKPPKKEKVVPNLPQGKQRLAEMQKLFGEKAQKIMGMETALELNYQRHLEQSNASHWPNLPIRMTFD